nr:MAG TPA: hypothetical protein [Caudoviricetes sp.]
MLNKEMMLADSEAEPHILLTVGKEYGDFGFSKNVVGQVNRLPAWSVTDSIMYWLSTLVYDSAVDGVTGIRLRPTETTISDPPTPITITIHDVKATFRPELSFEDGPYGDPFNFQGSVGKTLPVYFDPPPDGYIDP